MTAAQFRERAALLFGPSWQTPLALALECSRTSVLRYASGERAIPAEIEAALNGLILDRAAVLTALASTGIAG